MVEEKRYTKKQMLEAVSMALEAVADVMEQSMEQAIEKVTLDMKEAMDEVEQEMFG